MKSFRFFVGFAAVIAVLLVPFSAHAVDTVALRAQIIEQRCNELITSIDQLQRRDLVSRTNLGREYENVSKQVSAFGLRVHNNNLDSKPYEQLLAQFDDATNNFRDAYVHYDDSLNKLKQVNCQQKPGDFDLQLAQTRNLRDATDGAVQRAYGIIGQYRTMVAQMRDTLPEQNIGNSKQ